MAALTSSLFQRLATAVRRIGPPLAVSVVILAAFHHGPSGVQSIRRLVQGTAAASPSVATNAAVRVRGKILLGATPAQGLRLQLIGANGFKAGVATTDTDGQFDLGLSSPGEYVIAVGTLETLPSTHRYHTFTAGDNVLEVSLPPTRLEVVLAPASDIPQRSFRQAGVQLTLYGPLAPTSSYGSGFIGRNDEKRAVFVGLGYGTYEITASSPSGLVSRALARVSLTESAPKATLEFSLGRRPLKLKVQDEAGQPIDITSAVAGNRVLSISVSR